VHSSRGAPAGATAPPPHRGARRRAAETASPAARQGSLHALEAKFDLRYEPRYLAYRDEGDLPRIGMALTRAYLPDTNLRTLVKLATTQG
jgi:lysylphosphatidylglycerol synthetase-like protein (DUF2156 family)